MREAGAQAVFHSTQDEGNSYEREIVIWPIFADLTWLVLSTTIN